MIGESLSRTCHAWPAIGYHYINSYRVQNLYPSTPNTYYPRGLLGLKDRQQSIRPISLLLQYILLTVISLLKFYIHTIYHMKAVFQAHLVVKMYIDRWVDVYLAEQ